MFLMDNTMIIVFSLIGVFVLIASIVTFVANQNTKATYSNFESKLIKLEKGMTKSTIISIIGFEPSREGRDYLVYRKRMRGYSDLGDHDTTEYVLHFNEYGGYLEYERSHSYRKTYRS